MENRRLILIGALAALVFFTYMQWQAWQKDNVREQVVTQTASAANGNAPLISDNSNSGAPLVGQNNGAIIDPTSAPQAAGDLITVSTDVANVSFASNGGHIVGISLNDYSLDIDHPDTPFPLMGMTNSVYLVEGSGLASSGRGIFPDENTTYNASQQKTATGTDVVFTHQSEAGIDTVKTYHLDNSSHAINVAYKVTNNSAESYPVSQYAYLMRSDAAPVGGGPSMGARSFFGGATYTDDDKYQKHDFGDLSDGDANATTNDGWIAMLQHYFVVGWLPGQNVPMKVSSKRSGDNLYRLQYVQNESTTLAPGETIELESVFYAGPKIKSDLEALPGSNFALTIDFGWLTVIANPLLFGLKAIYKVIANWGWAIVILTMCIKLIFFPLSAAAYRSSAKMKKLAPRLQTLKERHGDDRQRFQQEMMKMYKTEKINPAGGCLPILIQIPVFIALYWVLLESVELRQANFFWLKDLSIPDPIFILPLLYFASMWAMQKLNPAPLDAMQKKIMSAMPFVFSIMMIWFPSGLVLYWVVNNVLSLLQQWYITRKYAG